MTEDVVILKDGLHEDLVSNADFVIRRETDLRNVVDVGELLLLVLFCDREQAETDAVSRFPNSIAHGFCGCAVSP
jgi:hypothetical protein